MSEPPASAAETESEPPAETEPDTPPNSTSDAKRGPGTGRVSTAEQRAEYLRDIDRRLRQATIQVRLRVGAIQFSWVVVTIAGAAVAVVEAVGWPGWTAAVLGFLVVVFQGLERIFGRTTEGSRSVDVLRRDLGRERRLYLTGEGRYKDAEDPFSAFVEIAEELIARNDDEEVAYNAQLTGKP